MTDKKNSITYLLFLISFLSVSKNNAYAADCEMLPQPQDYLVCSGSDLTYHESDFQGPACAVGNVSVSNFALDSKFSTNCNSWTVGGNYTQENGSMDGTLTAGGDVTLNRTIASGKVKSGGNFYSHDAHVLGGTQPIDAAIAKDNVKKSWQFFEDQSKIMAAKKANSKSKTSDGVTTFAAHGNNQIFDIKSKDISETKVVKLDGTCSTPFIINVRGDDVVISKIDFQISPRLKTCIGQIFFNFPDAKSIVLNKSGGGSATPDEKALGVPGTILAPLAKLDFTDGLVTGGVFAGNIVGSGQVNYSKPIWPVEPTSQPSTSTSAAKSTTK